MLREISLRIDHMYLCKTSSIILIDNGGVRFRRPKAWTPLCLKEAKKGSEGVVVKIENLFVI
jgi:hypothetical protein